MYYILLIISILLLVVSLTFNKKYKFISKFIIFLFFMFFICLIGFRYGVGRDYFTYEYMFNNQKYLSGIEPLYSMLMYIIKTFFNKFHYLTFIMALLTNIFIYLGLKKRNVSIDFFAISIIIYISDLAFIYSNVMRQGVAVAIFFYSSIYIKERKLNKYLLFILLGAGFHYSILLMIPLYWLHNLNIKSSKYITLICISYILVATNIANKILNIAAKYIDRYSYYSDSNLIINSSTEVLSLGVLVKVILSIILIVLSYNVKESKYRLEINYYKIGIIINILALSTFMFDRIGIYFSVFSIVAIPELIKISKSRTKNMIFFIVIIVFFGLFTKSLLIQPEELMLEYQSVYKIFNR